MDALCHAIEAYFTPKANILSDMFAETAIKLIASNLREACAKGAQVIEARYIMSIAASLAIKAIESGSGLAHKMNSELVVKAHITHGAACTILIPHNMQFELEAAPQRFVRIAELMGEKVDGLSTREAAQKAVDAVKRLSKDVGMPQTLTEVGITEDDISGLVDNLFKFRLPMLQASTLRDVTRDNLVEIFRAAL